jgi:catalase
MPSPSLSLPGKLWRLLLIAAILLLAAAAFAYVGGWLGPQRLTPASFVDQFESMGGVHPGYRRAHAKGLCFSGYFQASGQARAFSSAPVLAAGRVPVVGRFSIGGSNPQGADGSAGVRSMALLLEQANGEQWRLAMNTPPVLPVATPQAFLEQLQALAPDPQTGKPDPARIKAFFAEHPESAAFLRWQASVVPSSSFASTRYHGIHAFKLVNVADEEQGVRWFMQPELAPEPMAADALADPDVLQNELRQRLQQGPLRWQLKMILAEPGDVLNDSSQPWPETRRQLTAGTLVVEAVQDQAQGACRDINFDPLILPQGIRASDDPILRARSAAYAESFKRRTRDLLHSGTGARP